jgi:hypothetical protein
MGAPPWMSDEDPEGDAFCPREAAREAERIQRIPGSAAVEDVSHLFKSPRGTMRLFPVQSKALCELMEHGRLFGPIGVGHGKTLISLLAGVALRRNRTLVNPPRRGHTVLFVPATLRAKTITEMEELYSKHWTFDTPTIVSYSQLSSSTSSDLLEDLRPDLIVCDEAHTLANDSARSRRFWRYIREHPNVHVIPLSGSFSRNSPEEYRKLSRVALRGFNPLPDSYPVAKRWSQVLSTKESFSEADRAGIRPFLDLRTQDHRIAVDEEDYRAVARREYAARTASCAGWVSADAPSTDAKLKLRRVPLLIPQDIQTMIKDVQDSWRRPDGEEFEDALSKYRYTLQIMQGYYMYWDWTGWPNDEPDKEWINFRAEWHREIRAFLSDPRKAVAKRDSPKNIQREILAGRIRSPASLLLAWEGWLTVHDRPRPPVKHEWLSDHMVEAVVRYTKENPVPMLIWVEAPHLAAKLEKFFPVYRAGGPTPPNRASRSIVLSLKVHREGLNLQEYKHSLLTVPPQGNTAFQQVVGRTWRAGQKEEVTVAYFGTELFDEKYEAIKSEARYVTGTLKAAQAALIAQWR